MQNPSYDPRSGSALMSLDKCFYVWALDGYQPWLILQEGQHILIGYASQTFYINFNGIMLPY